MKRVQNRPVPFQRALVCMVLALAALAGAFSQASAEEPAKRPNILLVIADDWGNDHSSLAGCKWIKTPAFDRVAREGVLFKNAFTSNPKCSPCRASLLTGRNSWQLEEAVNHFGIFPAKFAVYPDLLEAAGYRVGFTGKGWGPGDWKAGGFQRNPAGPEYSRRKLNPPTTGISRIDYAANFEDFLAERKPGQPFCFWLGTLEPHRDYEEGSGVRAGKSIADVTLPGYYPDAPVIKRDFLDYAVEVEWFDSHLARALRKLEELGELENTVVVVTSDHGCPFPRVKGQIYEDGFHIPLAIRWGAQIKPGRVVEDFINMRDLAPTFLELAGVGPHEQMTGSAFTALLRSEASGWIDRSRNRMVVGKERHDLGRPNDLGYPVRALRTTDFLYVHNYEPDRWPVCDPETGYRNCDDGPTKTFLLSRFDKFYKLNFGKRPAEELYRIDQDTECLHNLAGDPQYAQTKAALRAELEERLRKDGDPRALGNAAVFDTYQYTGPRTHSWDAWMKNQ